nr:uncharacterized protein LOC113828020 [Penaeus vannamei]
MVENVTSRRRLWRRRRRLWRRRTWRGRTRRSRRLWRRRHRVLRRGRKRASISDERPNLQPERGAGCPQWILHRRGGPWGLRRRRRIWPQEITMLYSHRVWCQRMNE